MFDCLSINVLDDVWDDIHNIRTKVEKYDILNILSISS
jgi:hypothetical protein